MQLRLESFFLADSLRSEKVRDENFSKIEDRLVRSYFSEFYLISAPNSSSKAAYGWEILFE